MGVNLAEAEIHLTVSWAINPGQVFRAVKWHSRQRPSLWAGCRWIEEGQKSHAQTLGFTVVDASTVIATHLNHIGKSMRTSC